MAVNTTKRKATPGKSPVSKTAAPKSAPTSPASGTVAAKSKATAPAAPEPKVVTVTDATVAAADLKKRELIDLVVERSGIKKKDAKPVVEAMLAVLGETIADGRELNLQPLGKLRINRTQEKGNGRVIVCKLRQSMIATAAAKTGLGAKARTDADKEALAATPE